MGARWRFLSTSVEATEALGEAVGEALSPGAVVALSGELGSGKTAFTRGLARGLGVEDEVSSPTYTLMHAYAGPVPLYHFDAWLEGREKALLADGGDEWLRADGVAVVEWAERVAPWLPEERLEVTFAHRGAERRSVLLEARGTPADGPLARLLAGLALPGLFADREGPDEPRAGGAVPGGA